MSKGKSRHKNPSTKESRQVESCIEQQGGEIIKYRHTGRNHHHFTYILNNIVYTYTQSSTPGVNRPDAHILSDLERKRKSASVSIHASVRVIAEAQPIWCKSKEQLAFEEQMGKRQKQLTEQAR